MKHLKYILEPVFHHNEISRIFKIRIKKNSEIKFLKQIFKNINENFLFLSKDT